MSPRPNPPKWFSRVQTIRIDQSGFTLVEIVVASVLLGLISTIVLGGLLYGMKEARLGRIRAAAAAWVQSEFDYLRLQGYAQLADDVLAGPRTVTPTAGYTTYGDISEPRIPVEFDRAVISVEDVVGLALRKTSITLYETPASSPYVIASTYVSDATYATAP